MAGKLSLGWVIVLLFLGVSMAACGSGESERVLEMPRELGKLDEPEEASDSSIEASESQLEMSATQSDNGAVVIESTPVIHQEIPELKTELTASDPEAVNLLSGEIQLLEFFAFW